MFLKSFATAAALAVGSLAFVNGPQADGTQVAPSDGERLFTEICQQCHTVYPPPNLAPPMRHVIRHLRQSFDTDEALIGHIVDFVPEPSAEASALPPMAMERFGLMPALPLPDESLEMVARYILTLEGAAEPGQGNGNAAHRGRPGGQGGHMRGGGNHPSGAPGQAQGQCARAGQQGQGGHQCAGGDGRCRNARAGGQGQCQNGGAGGQGQECSRGARR